MFNRWLNPLFKIGHKRKLEPDDMYSVLPEDRSQRLGEELQGWAQTSERREEEWEFPCGAKGLGESLPSSGFFWDSSPDTACSATQVDPRLSPLWRPVFPVHLWAWREPTATALEAELCPRRWGPWRRESARLSCLWPVSPANLGRNLFLESGTFPSRPASLVLQSLHCLSFRSPVSR